MNDQAKPLANVRAIITRTNYQTIINSRKHTLIADEPESAGGLDTGLSPTELLLASLSSCTAITLQIYINRKMWAIQQITVDLQLSAAGSGTLVKSNINVKGEISEEQRKRLEHIANICPVHKMLTGKIIIDTVIV